MRVAVDQGYKLADQMQGEVSHDAQVRLNVPRVRVSGKGDPVREIHFCAIGAIHVTKVLQPGDGKMIPDSVPVIVSADFGDLPDGYYNLSNVLAHADGAIRLTVDEETRVVATQSPYKTPAPFLIR
jgi:hypothetical protein